MPTTASSSATPAKLPSKAVFSRREVVVFASRCSIVITLWSDWFGSTSATTPRTAEMRPAGSPVTRMTKLSASPASSSSGLYTSGTTSFANPVCRTSLTTPTTVSHGASALDLRRIRLPTAL